MKIAVSGERLGRALPSTLNILINYFRPVSVKDISLVGRVPVGFHKEGSLGMDAIKYESFTE